MSHIMLLSTTTNRNYQIPLQITVTVLLIMAQYFIATNNPGIYDLLVRLGTPEKYSLGEYDNFLQGFASYGGTIPIIALLIIGVIQKHFRENSIRLLVHICLTVILGILVGMVCTAIKGESNIGAAIFLSFLFDFKKIVW